MNGHIASKPLIFVKSEEGNTYLCEKRDDKDVKKYSSKTLQRECIDESSIGAWSD